MAPWTATSCLARAAALKGETSRAAELYRELSVNFKNADLELPLIKRD
jgi:hypothetical protein